MEDPATAHLGDGLADQVLDATIADRLAAKAIIGRADAFAAADFAYVAHWSDGHRAELVEAASLKDRLRDKGGPSEVLRIRTTAVVLDLALRNVLASDGVLVNAYATLPVAMADPLRVAEAVDPDPGRLGARRAAEIVEAACRPHFEAAARRWTSAELCDADPPEGLEAVIRSCASDAAEAMGLRLVELRQLSLQRAADATERATAEAELQRALRDVANRDLLAAARSEEDMLQVVRQLAHERKLQEALQADELKGVGLGLPDEPPVPTPASAESAVTALERRVARLEARGRDGAAKAATNQDDKSPKRRSFRARLADALDRVKNFWGAVSATLVVLSVVFGIEPLSLGTLLEQLGFTQLWIQLILWAAALGSLYWAWRVGGSDDDVRVPAKGEARDLEARVRRLVHGYASAAAGHLGRARREAFVAQRYDVSRQLDTLRTEVDALLDALQLTVYHPDDASRQLSTDLRARLASIEEQLLDGGEALETDALAAYRAVLQREDGELATHLAEQRARLATLMGLLQQRHALTT